MTEITIPNAVVRMNAVVEAIRDGNRPQAIRLLWKRGKEIERKRDAAQREADAANAEMRAVLDFAEDISRDSCNWDEVRRACGWNGGKSNE